MARTALLDGLKELSKEGDKNINLKREEVASIYAKALELELKRPVADQRAAYQKQLVDELVSLQHRRMFPVFEALTQRSPFPAVRKQAEEADCFSCRSIAEGR